MFSKLHFKRSCLALVPCTDTHGKEEQVRETQKSMKHETTLALQEEKAE